MPAAAVSEDARRAGDDRGQQHDNPENDDHDNSQVEERCRPAEDA